MSNPSRSRRTNRQHHYDNLETRNMLATLVDFDAGQLTVTMNEVGDIAVINTTGEGLVAVNGSTDTDSATEGIQQLAAVDVNDIVINSDATTEQAVTLGGSFSGDAAINSISITNAETVTFSGDYELDGSLIVTNATTVLDAEMSRLQVNGNTRFEAESVQLGDTATDLLTFRTVGFDVFGDVEIHQDNQVILTSTTAGNLNVSSTNGGIFDTRFADINVDGLAQFNSERVIRLGEHGTDSFNAGTLNFNALFHVSIFEDSTTTIVGDNTANSLDVTSLGDIVDAADASIRTNFASGFTAENITLGETDIDFIDLGALYFWSTGTTQINTDTDLLVMDGKNRAENLALTSTGSITDRPDARITVTNQSVFEADSVRIGERATDFYSAGVTNFTVTNSFFLREDDGTRLGGPNTAASADIGAAGNISTSDFSSIDITNHARFQALNIDIGSVDTNTANFGSLEVVATGDVLVEEDSGTTLAGENAAENLTLRSTGTIGNSDNSTINVGNAARFQSVEGVNIGTANNDEFNAQFINARATDGTGNVVLSEDSDTILTGLITANAMAVTSAGFVTNTNTADIAIDTNLRVEAGGRIDLGTRTDDETGVNVDRLTFSSITFNTTDDVVISTENDVLIVGNNTANNLNIVAQDGEERKNIRDQVAAQTIVSGNMFLTGLDLIIGELDTDCLDVAGTITPDATGTNQIIEGC